MTSRDTIPQTLDNDPELDAFLAAECGRLSVPGCAVGVLAGGRSIAAFYGVTDVDHPLPVDAGTLFLIGSTTKTLTATTVMALVHEGRLSLDDLVISHLPELELREPAARGTVTVGHLLDHTAGWRGDIEIDTGWGDDAVARALPEIAAHVPQVFAPGAMASYNNLSLVIAGRLIERIAGQSYEAAVRDRVLMPLGMTETFFFPWEVATRCIATGHVTRGDALVPSYVWPTTRGMGPAGGAISTVRDQLRYARFHLDGTAAGTPPIPDALREQMQQPRVTLPANLTGIGLSWLLNDRGGLRTVAHGGNNSNLFVSSFTLAPDEGFAITVLTNSRGGGSLGATLSEWAFERFLGRAAAPSPPTLPVTEQLLAEYVGRYDAGQWDLDVTARDGKLFIQMQLTDVAPDTPEDIRAAFTAPPSEYVLTAQDVLAPATAPGLSSGDFIRDADGRVGWLRQGMRVARRR
ncbi:MAG: serine hydrolase [Actinomycetota bacterium]|nr:serine hydrolase [Actinomycetota bacterium]